MARETARKGANYTVQKTATIAAEKRIAQKTAQRVSRGSATQAVKTGSRNHLFPDVNATGAHSTFRRDPMSGKVTHYETYRPQTNRFDPKPWESVKRFDGHGGVDDRHYNKLLKTYVDTPHVHDTLSPGGVRKPEIWEIPN